MSASKDEQRRCRDCLKSLNAAPSQMSRNVLEGVKNGRIGSFKEALKVMTDIAAHEQLKSLAREAESSEEGGGMGQNWTSAIARTLGSKHSRHWEQPDRVSRALVAFGHELPPLELNKRSKRVFQNSIRIGQYYSGFVSQQCDAETVADGTPSMLYQFGRDVGGVMGIYGGSPSEFPGRGGVLISSIDRSKIYGIGDDPDDPFKAFKEAWPTRAKAIDLLHKAEFVLTRGLISVTIPSTDDFKLTLSENESEHLTFVLYNDHHRNTGERAHLVSTNSFRGKVRDSLFDPEVGLDIGEVKDINDAKLTAKDLLALREDGYYKALDVGAAVNFVGGYSYSFPTDSPHFRWSNSEIIVGDNFTRDHFGYPNYESRQEVVMQIGGDIMQMRYLDDQIGEMVKLGLDLIDLLFIAQSDWKKGFTSGTLDFLPTEHSQPESELPQPDQYRDIVPTESPDNEFIHNQPSLRMLVQAYNYRKEWLQKDKDRERYRVLGLCNTLEPANQLGEDNLEGDRIWLDTWDMKLHVGSVVYELPLESDGTGPEESAIWLGTIIPQLTDTFKTVRFFDRISISDSIETE